MVNSIDTIMYNLNILNDKNAKVNHGLSTGEALEYGSDDAVQYNYILGVQEDIKKYESIQDSINFNMAFNTSSHSTLGEIKSTTEAIMVEVIKANTDTTNDEDRLIIAQQIEDYQDTLLSLANSSVNGQYLFSGQNTNTQPFVKDETTGVIPYQSDNSLKSVNVESNRYVPQGVNGIDVFFYSNQTVATGDSFTFSLTELVLDEYGNEWKLLDSDNDGVNDALYLNGDTTSSSIPVVDNGDETFTATNSSGSILDVKRSVFDDLNELISALKYEDISGNTITKDEADSIISSSQDRLDKAYSSQNVSHAVVGTRTNTINTYSDIVQTKLTNFAILEEEYASADLTALAIEAQSLENTYTALYSTINRVNNLSLIQYLN